MRDILLAAKSGRQGSDISSLCTFQEKINGTEQIRPQMLIKQAGRKGEVLI